MKPRVMVLLACMLATALFAKEVTFELVTEDLLPQQELTSWISTGDIDHDGLVDIIASNDWHSMALFEQAAPGSTEFVLLDSDFVFSCSTQHSVVSSLFDFDDDGLWDLVVCYTWYTSAFWRYEQTDPYSYDFELTDTAFLNEDGEYIHHKYGVFIDHGEDGIIDYLAASNTGLRWYSQNPDNPSYYIMHEEYFSNVTWAPGENTIPAFGNIDDNGVPDMLVYIANYFHWFELDSELNEYMYNCSIEDLYGFNRWIRLIDFDNDGDDDLLCVDDWNVELWENTTVAVMDESEPCPVVTDCSAYPNPFNPETTIRFSLPQPSPVTLEVFNIRGQRVDTLLHEPMQAGEHSVVWRADGLASGVYLARLRTAEGSGTARIVLLQ